jgi:hypothetical protein
LAYKIIKGFNRSDFTETRVVSIAEASDYLPIY